MTATDDSGSENEANDFVRSADRMIASMDRTIAQMDRIIQFARESNAVLRENRAIALAIAEHLGITIEERVSSVHSG